MNIRVLLMAIAGLSFTLQGVAQNAESLVKTKMESLNMMEGTWKGSGWMQRGPERVDFSQLEEVSDDLNGAVMVIKGKGWDKEKNLIHNALGILTFDPAEEKYLMNSYLEKGQHMKTEVLVDGNNLEWGFPIGTYGFMKYKVVFENDIWKEEGFFSSDKKEWNKIMEFVLTKK